MEIAAYATKRAAAATGRLQARIAVEELYAAHPHAGVDADAAVRALSPFTRGFVSLPATGLESGRR
ncbi:hypothetical protein [Dietzia sp. E1]|uniref:hypothetical protein n=1 Tax=Dietzia sp. E1 TaxID=328361 RepID=UPI0019D5F588|nr:hypothetical protein [Dietzia sp. E1]